MATWFDIFALVLTVAIFGGVVYGVMVIKDQISQSVQNTRETLKKKGVHISDKGVAVKTNARMTREDYIDATQRGMNNAMKYASFSTADNVEKPTTSRQNSGASFASASSSQPAVDKVDKKGKSKKGSA